MPQQTVLELIGYVASILILISLLMSSALKLRILNAVGSVVFTVYGILIASYPTAFLNGVSVIVDLYYIVKLLRKHTCFTFHQVGSGEAGLQAFLEFYQEDISRFFPNFDFSLTGRRVYMVYTDGAPVGLLVGSVLADGGLVVEVDYSTPRYRDCSVGKFLYSALASAGIPALVTGRGTKEHEAYLKRSGFAAQGNVFIKTLQK